MNSSDSKDSKKEEKTAILSIMEWFSIIYSIHRNNINNKIGDGFSSSISSININHNNSNYANTNFFSNNDDLNSLKDHFDSNNITKEKTKKEGLSSEECSESIQASNNIGNVAAKNNYEPFFTNKIKESKNLLYLILYLLIM